MGGRRDARSLRDRAGPCFHGRGETRTRHLPRRAAHQRRARRHAAPGHPRAPQRRLRPARPRRSPRAGLRPRAALRRDGPAARRLDSPSGDQAARAGPGRRSAGGRWRHRSSARHGGKLRLRGAVASGVPRRPPWLSGRWAAARRIPAGGAQMKSVVLRLFERERGVFAGAVVIAAACIALGVPIDFVLFGLTLAGVALFHHHTLQVALIGLAVILAYKLGFAGFKTGAGLPGLARHMANEWVILTNLFGLLLGFALLSNHFEESRVPAVLPRFLPDDWKGAWVLLFMIFVLSSFLDNIAAALIGGTIARTVFRGKVHIGYLAAIVAASNAGGSGSVVGDTTTTMMWIDGVDPLDVLEAFVAAGAAMLVFGIPASLQQQRYSPILKDMPAGTRVDWARVAIVGIILAAAIAVNVT